MNELIKGAKSYIIDNNNYKDNLLTNIRSAYKLAHEHNKLAHNKNVKYFKTRNKKQFSIGDLVLLKNEYRVGPGAKLKSRYVGPYRIKEKYSPNNYIITPLHDRTKRDERVHINRLKTCHSPNYMVPDYEQYDSNIVPVVKPVTSEIDSSDDESELDYIVNIPNHRNQIRNPEPEQGRYQLRSQGQVANQLWIPERPVEFLNRPQRNRIINFIGFMLVFVLLKIIII
jgi:hypothetical protein